MLRPSHLLLLTAFLAALSLSLPGLKWGLPSEERGRLLFGDLEARKAAMESAKNFVDEGTWARSHANPSDPEVMRNRSTFDMIRSFGPDEQDIIKPLASMKPKQLDFNPHRFVYPSFFTYIIGGGLGVSAIFKYVTIVPSLDYYFMHPEEFARFYVVGRLMVILFSLLTIAATFKLGKAMYGEVTGGLAAIILAITPMWAIMSHYLKVDIPGIFWITATIYCSWLFLDGAKTKFLVLAGIFAGCAAGTKYNFGIIVLTPLMAAFLSSFRTNRFISSFTRAFVIVGAASLAAFLITNPYIVLSFQEFIGDFRNASRVVTASKLPWMQETGPEIFYYLLHVFPVSFGGPLYAAIIVGTVIALSGLERREIVLLAFVIPFGIFLQLTGGKMSSFFLPLMPVLAIWAAWGFIRIMRDFKVRRASTAIVTLVLLSTAWAAAAEVSLFTRSNTRESAARFIDANIRAGSTIGVMGTPIAFHTPVINARKYSIRILDSPAAVTDSAPDAIVISDYWMEDYRRLGTKADQGETLQTIDMLYDRQVVIEERPSFLGIERWRPRITPQDWLHPSPRVTILLKTPPVPPPSPASDSEAGL